MNTGKFITVIGSYNVGLFLKGKRLPRLGETVIGDEYYESYGGKGSNQAIAASILGANVYFLGRIGNDRYGADALAIYKKLGMPIDLLKVDNSIHSGISVIIIDSEGNNMISCVPGANFKLSKDDIDECEDYLNHSSIVAFQLESPLDVVCYAIRKVHRMGITTLLDPAPAVKLPEDIFECINIIKPNETEAEILTGMEVTDFNTAAKAGEWLIDRGAKNVIITLGSNGVFYTNGSDSMTFIAPSVERVDSTGAGDIFSGALMSALSRCYSFKDAIEFANYAASLSVTKLGVIESIPTLDEVENFIQSSI